MAILLAMNTRLAKMIPALLAVIAVACATQPTSNLTPTSSPPPLLPAATPQNADLETLVASALAGGNCIDDADALRAGGTARVLGFTAKAPSTPRFREGRLWAPSCAASGGAMSANWTG